jgi:glycosyltransferase involved in cell wall biosynthesis
LQRGVDTESFHPRFRSPALRTRLTDGHPQDKLLLFAGRLSPEKEIEQCLPILQTVPGLRLALVGDGPHRRKLEQHFEGTPTHFAGYLRGADLAAAFASADVFFLPSRSETLGLVLLEAMAAGCPVVAVAEGGIVDIVQDGVTGHLYKPDNLQGAIAAIHCLLSHENHRETIRRQARAEVERWGWAAATEQLVGFYRAIFQEELYLPRQIAEISALGASIDEICGKLGISRATFRRHAGEPVPQYAVR